jgi:hypothetical protein
MLKEGELLPEIYTDPAFGQSSHWELSTSQLSSQYLDGWGYGEGGFSFFLLVFFLLQLFFWSNSSQPDTDIYIIFLYSRT